MVLAFAIPARGQEIPRPSIARQKEIRPPPGTYNVRIGQILFLADASLGVEYIDNVALTATGREGDLVFYPTLALRAAWRISKLNTLQLQTGISYTKYLSHPQLDTRTLLLSPDSEIRMNLFVGDFRISFHDRFSVQQDPVTQDSVNGVASIGRIINIAGVSVLWDMNDVIWSVGYNHLTLKTTGATTLDGNSSANNVNFLDRTTDQVSSAITFRTGMSALAGIEGTAATTRYTTGPSSDYSAASIGPFVNVQLTRYTQIVASAGYRKYFSDTGAASATAPSQTDPDLSVATAGGTGSDGVFYGSLSFVHRLNRYYSDRLTIARDSQVGLYADRLDINSISYASVWTLGRQLSLSTSLSFEDVHQTIGPLGGSIARTYQQFGGSLGTNYNLTKRVNLSLAYQLTIKVADATTEGYSQNRMRLGLHYQF